MARFYANENFVGQAGRIHTAVATLPEMAGQLLRVNRPAK